MPFACDARVSDQCVRDDLPDLAFRDADGAAVCIYCAKELERYPVA